MGHNFKLALLVTIIFEMEKGKKKTKTMEKVEAK